MSSYSINTFFIKTNSSWVAFKSIKASEIKVSMLFNLDFAKNTIFPCYFFFFLIIDLYFLNQAALGQTFNLIAEHVILTEIPSKETKAEIKINPVIAEAKIRKCSI